MRCGFVLFAIFSLDFAVPAFSQTTEFTGDAGGEFRTLSGEEASRALSDFRRLRQEGHLRLRFSISHAVADSDEDTRHEGEMCLVSGAAAIRVDFRRGEGAATPPRRLLILRGATPAVYELGEDGAPRRVDAGLLAPFLPGLVFTPYDLQLPFLDWTECKYLETERFRTRPTDYFRMLPDEGFKRSHPQILSVKAGFDRAYHAIIRAETFDLAGKPARDFRVESFGKVNGRWIVREIKLRDIKAKASDTLSVEFASVGEKLPDTLFMPEGLSAPIPPDVEKSLQALD